MKILSRFIFFVISFVYCQTYTTGQDLTTINSQINSQISKDYLTKLSPGALELATNLHILSLIKYIQENSDINLKDNPQNFDEMLSQFNLLKAKGRYNSILFKASLEIDSFTALVQKEINQNHELELVLSQKANKRINMTNFASFWSNGALWAVAEAFDIPTYRNRYAKFSIVSGSTGILAGIIPSAFSIYSLPFLSSKQYPMESDPNMLSPLFNLKIPPSKQYPLLIWKYLNNKSLDPKYSGLSRKDALIKNWQEKGFLDSKYKNENEIDLICNSISLKKGYRLSTLGYRQSMLSDLSALIANLKVYLQELIQLTT